ncbi:FAD-binding oxidoreductase, partial [Bradyrhizobium sp. NAS80.1]|uniref:FAD-binding oxidoreductase n=1 Tax=Bradyrhizobium sp. NAS80.1 TaxID=1680159 RepID=UPI000B2F997D
MPSVTSVDALSPGLLEELSQILGSRGVSVDQNEIAPHLSDWRSLYHGAAAALIKPDSTAALAQAVKVLAAAGIAMVPQGGRTSMVGGATPDASVNQVVVSMLRLNRIRDIDTLDMSIVAEAGVILKNLQDAAMAAECYFPLSLASEGSATVGGVLSTNAGGNTTVRYGNARELMLGLEVVLPNGEIIHGLRRLRKDNTGYALRHLFVGGEGTLGIITAAALRLFPRGNDECAGAVHGPRRRRCAGAVPALPPAGRDRDPVVRVHVRRSFQLPTFPAAPISAPSSISVNLERPRQ